MIAYRKFVPALSLLLLVFFGCTTIHPPRVPAGEDAEKTDFSHAPFERVLQRFGSPSGRIDYAALRENPHDLNRYYRSMAAVSPDSHPQRFASDSHRLAYWINAYNAAAIKIVLHYYPIGSVRDVRPPAVLFFLPEESGFFVFQKVVIGDRRVSLYHLENGIIRKRFADPRVHFALNCASLGCPRLPSRPFSGDRLDEQLDREARRFMAEERNVRIDHENRTVFLSQIFTWYEEDFIDWLRRNDPENPARLTRYVSLYLPGEKAAVLKKVEGKYALQFVAYDWTLNDRR